MKCPHCERPLEVKLIPKSYPIEKPKSKEEIALLDREGIVKVLAIHRRPTSQRQLADETGMGRRRLKNRLEELAEEGIVNITREGIILLKEEKINA